MCFSSEQSKKKFQVNRWFHSISHCPVFMFLTNNCNDLYSSFAGTGTPPRPRHFRNPNIWSGWGSSVFMYHLFYLDIVLLLQTISTMFAVSGSKSNCVSCKVTVWRQKSLQVCCWYTDVIKVWSHMLIVYLAKVLYPLTGSTYMLPAI